MLFSVLFIFGDYFCGLFFGKSDLILHWNSDEICEHGNSCMEVFNVRYKFVSFIRFLFWSEQKLCVMLGDLLGLVVNFCFIYIIDLFGKFWLPFFLLSKQADIMQYYPGNFKRMQCV